MKLANNKCEATYLYFDKLDNFLVSYNENEIIQMWQNINGKWRCQKIKRTSFIEFELLREFKSSYCYYCKDNNKFFIKTPFNSFSIDINYKNIQKNLIPENIFETNCVLEVSFVAYYKKKISLLLDKKNNIIKPHCNNTDGL